MADDAWHKQSYAGQGPYRVVMLGLARPSFMVADERGQNIAYTAGGRVLFSDEAQASAVADKFNNTAG